MHLEFVRKEDREKTVPKTTKEDKEKFQNNTPIYFFFLRFSFPSVAIRSMLHVDGYKVYDVGVYVCG
jgi:hypothetical protein